MSVILAQFGAILFQLGAFAALLVIAPVLYGVVIAMPRLWSVMAAAGLTALLVIVVAAQAAGVAQSDAAIGVPVPDAAGYVGVALGYVLLAMITRLSTLRLEWRGWEKQTLKDVHVLAFVVPTAAAFVVAWMPSIAL